MRSSSCPLRIFDAFAVVVAAPLVSSCASLLTKNLSSTSHASHSLTSTFPRSEADSFVDMAAGMSKEVKGVASDTFVVVSAADGVDSLFWFVVRLSLTKNRGRLLTLLSLLAQKARILALAAWTAAGRLTEVPWLTSDLLVASMAAAAAGLT